MSEQEPRIWSGITDELPAGHPLAWESVYCSTCGEMVHGIPNENMQPWVESGKGPYCLPCFAKAWSGPDETPIEGQGWGLPA